LREQIDRYVESRFESELYSLEMRWTHNPYMQEFRSSQQQQQQQQCSVRSPFLVDAFSSQAASDDEEDDNSADGAHRCEGVRQAERHARLSYADLVQQIAYDFRRHFFESWARELRHQRPFMNEHQRQLLHQMIVERFGEVEHGLRQQVEELHKQNQSLRAELHDMLRSLMQQQVEVATLADRIRCTQRACLEKQSVPPPIPTASSASSPASTRSSTPDMVDTVQQILMQGTSSLLATSSASGGTDSRHTTRTRPYSPLCTATAHDDDDDDDDSKNGDDDNDDRDDNLQVTVHLVDDMAYFY